MKLFKTHKKLAVSSLALVVALVAGGAAFAYFTSGGTGTGSATIGSASPLAVSVGTPLGASLIPTAFGDGNGVTDTVPFTVTNNGEGNVNLNSVIIEVTPGFNYIDAAGDPACTAADFSINGQAVGTPVTVTGINKTLNGSSDTGNNVYTSSFTIQMVDNGANQDSCEGGSVPLTVIANSPPTNMLSSIAYYTVTPNSGTTVGTWTRSTSPFASDAPDTQSVSGSGAVTLGIAASSAYADNGFYMTMGTLGSLTGYTIHGTGSAFGTNLYLGYGSGSGSDFFTWSGGNFAGVGSTVYGLGPTSSGGIDAVTGSSSFYLSETAGSCASGTSVTLTQLKTTCGVALSTPVAVWVGITSPSGAALNTTITSVTSP